MLSCSFNVCSSLNNSRHQRPPVRQRRRRVCPRRSGGRRGCKRRDSGWSNLLHLSSFRKYSREHKPDFCRVAGGEHFERCQLFLSSLHYWIHPWCGFSRGDISAWKRYFTRSDYFFRRLKSSLLFFEKLWKSGSIIFFFYLAFPLNELLMKCCNLYFFQGNKKKF